jgi:hypothetical protein
MYADIRGLITVGVGNLIDPIEYALGLPFVHLDGTPASRAEISFEWRVMKRDKLRLAKEGHRAAAKLATLRLPLPDIDQLVRNKLLEFERQVTLTFPAFPGWPADAQCGVLSMSWAAGAGIFPRAFPRFSRACRELDFRAAADECRLDDSDNPGLRPRNAANAIMFRNAADALDGGLDPSVLHYPETVAISIPPDALESGPPPPPLPTHPDVVAGDVERHHRERDGLE